MNFPGRGEEGDAHPKQRDRVTKDGCHWLGDQIRGPCQDHQGRRQPAGLPLVFAASLPGMLLSVAYGNHALVVVGSPPTECQYGCCQEFGAIQNGLSTGGTPCDGQHVRFGEREEMHPWRTLFQHQA